MALEQCVGAEIDGRTDLYSLGLIMYEMLTGESAFADKDSLKTIRHQLSTPTPPMARAAAGVAVPASLEAVVRRLTEKQPENRYASAAQTLVALAEVAEKEGILPPEPSAQLPALPARPAAAGKDSAIQTVASMELVSETELPATSVALSIRESQILAENVPLKPSQQADTMPALALPTVRLFAPAANTDQKTALLPASLAALDKRSLLNQLKARLPPAVQNVPQPLLLLALAAFIGLLFALLLR